ncbi:MAG: hydantoinase/oxoprolinase family protein [Candidatus Riflebacteria bacterium]|nr:hydantoinase/oxoprolinase family protein [Candidatus Riflebacteria bacterium]
MAIIGLDVGGTHTDAVLIESGRIVAFAKQFTDRDDLAASLGETLRELLKGFPPSKVGRIQLSTTLSTNLIAEGKLAPVGLILQSGPGRDPAFLACASMTRFLSGAVDHRGCETSPFSEKDVQAAAADFCKAGISSVAVVTKFSTRNPAVERRIASALGEGFNSITLGHEISGSLNFPRRVFGAWLNAAVVERFRVFSSAVRRTLSDIGLSAPVFMLKADGGTMPLDAAERAPIQTIQSGPAASIMGALTVSLDLETSREDALLLDIGGTTTDIAFLADGVPLFLPRGVVIGGRPTPVRGLWSQSIALGGDCRVTVMDNTRIMIGPDRDGPAAALGGPSLTPGDALIVLGLARFGDSDRAHRAMKRFAAQLGVESSEAARRIITSFVDMAKSAVDRAITEINNRPVYTIRELLAGRVIRPKRLSVIGGPAAALTPALSDVLHLPMAISRTLPGKAGTMHLQAANAIGAALSQPTIELTLIADTFEGHLTVPELGLRESIDASFTLENARAKVFELLGQYVVKIWQPAVKDAATAVKNADVSIDSKYVDTQSLSVADDNIDMNSRIRDMEIIEESCFNVVEGFSTRGRRFRVKAHVRPALLTTPEGKKC